MSNITPSGFWFPTSISMSRLAQLGVGVSPCLRFPIAVCLAPASFFLLSASFVHISSFGVPCPWRSSPLALLLPPDRERELFIGTQFSILYTSLSTFVASRDAISQSPRPWSVLLVAPSISSPLSLCPRLTVSVSTSP